MKHFTLLSFLILISCIKIYTQSSEFAPIGTKWWYDYTAQFGPEYGYILIESANDTVIDMQPCRELERTEFIYFPWLDIVDTIHMPSFFVYSDSSKVYYYDNDAFYLLYDFGSVPGDIWMYENYEEILCEEWPYPEVYITDTATFVDGAIDLRKWIVTSDDSSGVGFAYGASDVLEYVGSVNYFTPVYLYCPTDDYRGGPLRCYQDPEIFIAFYDDEDTAVTNYGCDPFAFPVEIESEFSTSNSLYPNPASHKLFFQLNSSENVLVEIYDITGERIPLLIHASATNVFESDISGLRDGIYFVRFIQNNKTVSTQKFIVN